MTLLVMAIVLVQQVLHVLAEPAVAEEPQRDRWTRDGATPRCRRRRRCFPLRCGRGRGRGRERAQVLKLTRARR